MSSHSVMADSFAAPWTAVCQDPLSMGLSKQEYWSNLLFPTPGEYSQARESNVCLLPLLHWWADSLPLEPPGKPLQPEWSSQNTKLAVPFRKHIPEHPYRQAVLRIRTAPTLSPESALAWPCLAPLLPCSELSSPPHLYILQFLSVPRGLQTLPHLQPLAWSTPVQPLKALKVIPQPLLSRLPQPETIFSPLAICTIAS